MLTHWGQVTHICISKLTIIGSNNGLSPGQRQAIIWTNAGILLIGPMGINFSEILIKIHTFSFKKMHLKMLSGKCRPFCLVLNVLMNPASLHVHSTLWSTGYSDTQQSKHESLALLTLRGIPPFGLPVSPHMTYAVSRYISLAQTWFSRGFP